MAVQNQTTMHWLLENGPSSHMDFVKSDFETFQAAWLLYQNLDYKWRSRRGNYGWNSPDNAYKW